MSLTQPLAHPALDDDGDSGATSGIESRISLNHPKHGHSHGHGHGHGSRGAEVAAASAPAASYDYSFHPDATAVAAGVSLHSLNTAPDSHAAALLQLHIAKQYIARAQAECRERAQRRPVLSSYGTDNSGTEALLSPMRGPDSDVLEIDSSPDGTGAPGSGAPPEMSPDDYYKTPWWKLLLKRLPWLVVLLLLQSFGALILNQYDKLLEKHLVLNFFIPMMQGTSGNAGNQVRPCCALPGGGWRVMGAVRAGSRALACTPVQQARPLTLDATAARACALCLPSLPMLRFVSPFPSPE